MKPTTPLARIGHMALLGSIASVASTAVVVIESMRRTGHAAAGTNGASQWIWGTSARHRRGASVRHTLVGYLIHHASSLLWAAVYDSSLAHRLLRRRDMRAGATAALAAVVDYAIVPRRFTPGFEKQMSVPAIAATYAAFALGLAFASPLHRAMSVRFSPAHRSDRGRARRDH